MHHLRRWTAVRERLLPQRARRVWHLLGRWDLRFPTLRSHRLHIVNHLREVLPFHHRRICHLRSRFGFRTCSGRSLPVQVGPQVAWPVQVQAQVICSICSTCPTFLTEASRTREEEQLRSLSWPSDTHSVASVWHTDSLVAEGFCPFDQRAPFGWTSRHRHLIS